MPPDRKDDPTLKIDVGQPFDEIVPAEPPFVDRPAPIAVIVPQPAPDAPTAAEEP